MNTRPAPRAPDAGFTLIEMLVVIAIIALLSSLIMPAVGKTMAKARTTQCASNMRQAALGVIQYATDHKGELPLFEAWQSQVGYTTNWAGELIKGGFIDAPVATDPDDLPTASVFMCTSGLTDAPAQLYPPSDSPWSEDPNAHRPWAAEFELDGQTTYVHIWFGMNARTEADSRGNQGWPFIRTRDPEQRTRLSMVRMPAKTVMIYDGVWSHNRRPGRIMARHGSPRRYTNMAFMDGSVRAVETRIFDVENTDDPSLYPRFHTYEP